MAEMLRLRVTHSGRHVGTLGYLPASGRWSFSYDADWRALDDAFMLSPQFPLHAPADSFDSDAIKRFVVNLFPEGRALEIALEQLRVSKNNHFALLQEFGKDTSGAFEFLADENSPAPAPPRPVTCTELSERIRGQADDGLAIWDGKVRMSVAGFQNKLLVYVDGPLHDLAPNPPMFLVESPLASTVILKPQPPRIAGLVANEHFCMRLAKACGFPAAEVALLRVPEPVLAVRRFDRKQISAARVERIHVIDACQAADLSVDFKYERYLGAQRPEYRDGMSLPKLFAISGQAGGASTRMRLELMQWALFQLVIGNSDAHGKNFSFFVRGSWLDPAPWYDLVSVVQFDQFDHAFAMGIGDAFDWSELTAMELAYFVHLCGIPLPTLQRECTRLARVIPRLAQDLLKSSLYEADELEMLHRVAALASANAHRLVQMAKDAKVFTAEYFQGQA